MKRFVQQLPRGAFWTYFTAALFFNFGFSLFFFLFNVYLLGLGYNERTLGFISSCALTGRLLATLPVGWLAERFGLRATLFTAVALSILTTFARIAIPSQTAQFVLAFIAGMSLCAWGVCLPPTIAALTTEARRPVAFSLIFASGIGDAGIGAYAAGRLPGLFTHHAFTLLQSERTVLTFGIAVAALSLIPIARLKLTSPHLRTKLSFLPARSTFLKPFLLAMGIWSVVLGAFPPFANVFFVHHLNVSLSSMGSILSVAQALPCAAILLAPFLFRKIGLAPSILLTQVLTAAALFSLGGAHTAAAAAISYWLYTAAQNSNEPAIASLLMDRVPAADRNSASSLSSLTTAAAQILASAAVGVGIVRFGYSSVLYTIAGLALIAAALFYRLPRPRPISAQA